ncbi:MAG: phosphate signaling complex protein PhoU [Rhizobiales bacterium TMED83]|jgi:phosphate transport system protein|nr:phosphate transport system regulatory protein PhoU [Rhodobiaceae bacterium]RPF93175.1 MAG: phosphate signaling complex protein PhoU [Rhizobiales bacterium TMED83]HCD16129.1 phosphate transport system regulatory protein PhoU [Rhodobiaceae bacterium]|tara:strand:- start:344 stop:1057 length:714 start_codon:yes stop_codon:yes gene_type:complete
MASGHIVASFDDDLAELNKMLARLGGLAEKQFADAIDALERRDIQNIDEIIARDAELDEMEFDLNERGIEIIALRAPVAQDLRRVIVTLKVASVLERIGDYAKNVAKRSRVIIEHENNKSDNVSLARMAALVQQMLNQVLDAYVSGDADLAMDVRDRDMEVDRLHTSLFREMLARMSENPEQVSASSHLLFIAKNIERIGDHTTGIAEQIFFLRNGQFPSDERPKADKSSVSALGRN